MASPAYVADALYVPAGIAFTVHVKSVKLEVAPGSGPVDDKHDDAGPASAHDTFPAGDVAPRTPVTVAVYVIVPPRTGLEGAVTTVTTGVAGATTMETGV